MSLSLKKWNKLTWRQPVALAIAICLTSLVPQTVYGQTDTGDQGTPEPTPTAPTQTGITVHVVQAGETLDQIAASYGILPDSLQQANGLESLDDLAIGQRLVIPSSDVVRGTETALVANLEDSLYVLSARYQVPVEDLGLMNRIVNPTRLVAGQNLIAENDRTRALAVVRGKERQSWLGVAVANELNPWALRLMNPGLDIILPGEYLVIPSEGVVDQTLPSPWKSIVLHPLPLERGRVGGLRIQTDQPGEVAVSFMGADWPVAGDGNQFDVLVSVDRLSATGVFPLTIRFTGQGGSTSELTRLIQVRGGGYDRERIILAANVAAVLSDPVAVEGELAYLRQVMTGFTLERYWDGLFRLPAAGVLTSGFGTLRSYNGSDFNTFHSGADIAGPIGTPIYAPADGVVVDTGLLEVRGFVTIIDHGWGVYTGYWHQSSILVNPGDRVTAGQQIGEIGNTGLSTASHVHWEMWVAGHQVDAMQWVREVFP